MPIPEKMEGKSGKVDTRRDKYTHLSYKGGRERETHEGSERLTPPTDREREEDNHLSNNLVGRETHKGSETLTQLRQRERGEGRERERKTPI